jgi:protein O-mannosyl-transferase
MKSAKRETKRAAAAPAARPPAHSHRLAWTLAAAVAALLVLWAYSPAARAPLVFDDNFLPFAGSDVAAAPLARWIHGQRPVLMLTYWANARISGEDTLSYHLVNVLVHLIASGLVFAIVRRLLARGAPRAQGQTRDLLAGFAAAVFLLHPVQTEAVAYLAGRSEALSVALAFAAYAVFLYRGGMAASWGAALAVLALFGAALLAKEHTIVLPALLLLTDYWWNPGFSFQGIRRNWRIYAPMALAAAAAFALFWDLITRAGSAGFALKDFTWYQYFFTQWRALFVYIGQFLLPVRLTADWDFPISRTVFDHGAIAGLIALVALAAAAWHYRRRFPLASFGFFTYLVLMAPTSSILPIQDPVAERRLYFSMLGLLLIVVDVLSRVRVNPKALAAGCAAVVLAAAGATYARAQVWSDPILLWQDNVVKSPNKARDRHNLAFAYYAQGRADLALPEFERAAQLQPPTHELLLNWGLAYNSVNQPDRALAKLREAAALPPPTNISPAQVYTQIALVYANRAQWAEALDALETAQKLDPNFPEIYTYRGKVYLGTNQVQAAIEQYRRALAIDPNHQDARHDLAIAEARLRAGR